MPSKWVVATTSRISFVKNGRAKHTVVVITEILGRRAETMFARPIPVENAIQRRPVQRLLLSGRMQHFDRP